MVKECVREREKEMEWKGKTPDHLGPGLLMQLKKNYIYVHKFTAFNVVLILFVFFSLTKHFRVIFPK